MEREREHCADQVGPAVTVMMRSKKSKDRKGPGAGEKVVG